MISVQCNACGLPGRCFTSLACPSCGGDARAVGLSQPTNALVGRAAWVWTAIVGVTFLAAIIFVNTKRYTLSSAGFARSADRGPLRLFAATARGEGFAALPTPDRISLSMLTDAGVAVEANATLPAGRWAVRRAGAAATTVLPASLGRALIDDLLRYAGVDPMQPAATAQADEAMMIVEDALHPEERPEAHKQYKAFNRGGGGGRSRSQRRGADPWEPWLTCGFVGVWTIGLLALRHRGGGAPTALPAPPPSTEPAAAPPADVATGDGRCGHCGYACAGLSTPICPECGRDLRAIGISLPGRPARAATLAARQRWTAYVVLAGLALTVAVWQPLRHRSNRMTWTLPALDQSHTAVLTVERAGSVWPFYFDRAFLRFEPASSAAAPATSPALPAAQLEYVRGACGVPSLAAPTDYNGPLTPAAIGAAMHGAGLDPSLLPFSVHAAEWALRLGAINPSINNSLDLHVIGYGATGLAGSGSGGSDVGRAHLVWMSGLILLWWTGRRWLDRHRL